MSRVMRIIAVTVGLIVGGAIAGALAGGIAFSLVLVLGGGPGFSLDAFTIAAVFGAPLGAVAAPILAWLLLRRVSLGRMFVACGGGTMLGAVIGWFATPLGGNVILVPIVGAGLGCVTTAVALHVQRT